MSKYDELNLTLGETKRVNNKSTLGFNSEALDRLRNHIGDGVFGDADDDRRIVENKALDGEVIDRQNSMIIRQTTMPTCTPYVRKKTDVQAIGQKINLSGLVVIALFILAVFLVSVFLPAQFSFLKNNVQNKSNINFIGVSNLISPKDAAQVLAPITYTPKVFAKIVKVESSRIIYSNVYNPFIFASCDGIVADTSIDVVTGTKTVVVETNNTKAKIIGFLNVAVKKGDRLVQNTILGEVRLGAEIIVAHGG